MRFGSVCSGIEAASVAWEPLGWKAAWFAEIEAFPASVLAHRFPGVVNLGDMTAIAAAVRAGFVEAPDVLVGGTPCQAFSVAGVRAGLADPRGQLTLSYADLLNAIDEQRPGNECIAVWENVPGVLSDKTNAFGCFLGILAGESVELVSPGGSWPNAGIVHGPQRSIAWRVLDAQFFGVAQRRRRVFVVASARNGFDPAAILFESDGVRRDTAPRRQAGQDFTASVIKGAAIGREPHNGPQYGEHLADGSCYTLNCTEQRGVVVAPTLRGDDATYAGPERREGGENVPVIGSFRTAGDGAAYDSGDRTAALTTGTDPFANVIAFSCKDYGNDAQFDFTPTMRSMGHTASHQNGGGQLAAVVPVGFMPHRSMAKDGGVIEGFAQREISDALHCSSGTGNKAPLVTGSYATRDVAQTITSNYGKQCDNSDTALGPNVAIQGWQVRRLTPTECERLQGFPDGWTLVPHRNKPAADGPRYKSLGNSMAVPCMAWIGRRLLRYTTDEPVNTLSSRKLCTLEPD